jgi:hypothetical protein
MSQNSLKIRNALTLKPTSVPSNPENGDCYYDSTANLFYFYQNGSWVGLGTGGGGATVTITVTAGQTLNTNDALYIASSTDTGRTAGQAYQVDATNDNRIDFIGFAQAGVSSGATVTIVLAGPLTGFTGLTAGRPIFASTTTPGSYQTSAPTTAGLWMIQIGVATSTTAITINSAASATAVKIIANTGPSGTVYNTNSVTTSYAATSTDNVIFIGSISSALTITLPAPSNGKVIIVEDKNGNVSGTNTITITHNASETINGASNYLLTMPFGSVTLISDGTNWAAATAPGNPSALAGARASYGI